MVESQYMQEKDTLFFLSIYGHLGTTLSLSLYLAVSFAPTLSLFYAICLRFVVSTSVDITPKWVNDFSFESKLHART